MNIDELMEELDITSTEDFMYFEQFTALMEFIDEIEYDIFMELLNLPDRENLVNMTESFFEDLIRGVPDDDMELYSSIQETKNTLLELLQLKYDRAMRFYIHELYRFHSWLVKESSVLCTPEDGGASEKMSPCEAMMLYREERLSGKKYYYDFSNNIHEGPEDYTLEMLAELKDEANCSRFPDYDVDDYYENIENILADLPEEYDPDNYNPPAYDSSPIDPYTDGFVDKFNPVIDNLDGGYNDDDNDIDKILDDFSKNLP